MRDVDAITVLDGHDAKGLGTAENGRWLETLGLATPPVEELNVDLCYVTRHHRMPPELFGATDEEIQEAVHLASTPSARTSHAGAPGEDGCHEGAATRRGHPRP